MSESLEERAIKAYESDEAAKEFDLEEKKRQKHHAFFVKTRASLLANESFGINNAAIISEGKDGYAMIGESLGLRVYANTDSYNVIYPCPYCGELVEIGKGVDSLEDLGKVLVKKEPYYYLHKNGRCVEKDNPPVVKTDAERLLDVLVSTIMNNIDV